MVMPVNCSQLDENEIKRILAGVLFEFPIKEVKVDMVCMPGDIIDHVNDNRNKALLEVLKKVSSLAKTYISIGNHDIYEQGMEVKVNQEYNLDFLHLIPEEDSEKQENYSFLPKKNIKKL